MRCLMLSSSSISCPRRQLSQSRAHYRPVCRRRLPPLSASNHGAGLSPELKSALDGMIENTKVVVFIKGTKQFPQCGFSNTVVQILNSLNTPFEAVDILESDILRQGMKEYSQWPTFPQVYIDGEFFGGCDIMIEAFQSGQLAEILEKTMNA